MSTKEKTQVIARIHFDSAHKLKTINRMLKAFQTTIADNLGFMQFEYKNLDNYFFFPNGVEVRGIFAYIAAYPNDRDKYLQSVTEHFNGLDIRIKKPGCGNYQPLATQNTTQDIVR